MSLSSKVGPITILHDVLKLTRAAPSYTLASITANNVTKPSFKIASSKTISSSHSQNPGTIGPHTPPHITHSSNLLPPPHRTTHPWIPPHPSSTSSSLGHPYPASTSIKPIAIVGIVFGVLVSVTFMFGFARCWWNWRRTPSQDRIATLLHRYHLQREMEEAAVEPIRARVERPPPPPYRPPPPGYENVLPSSPPPAHMSQLHTDQDGEH